MTSQATEGACAFAWRHYLCGGRHHRREDVEGVKLHLVLIVPGVQAVEIGNAVHPQQHCFTIDDEMASFTRVY